MSNANDLVIALKNLEKEIILCLYMQLITNLEQISLCNHIKRILNFLLLHVLSRVE